MKPPRVHTHTCPCLDSREVWNFSCGRPEAAHATGQPHSVFERYAGADATLDRQQKHQRAPLPEIMPVVSLEGNIGAGKSTLLKAAMGILPLVSGQVTFFGKPLKEARHRVAYVPQRASVDWDFPATVYDVVLMGLYPSLGLLRRVSKADKAKVAESLAKVGMQDFVDRQIGQLSGGQQQRVFLARSLVQQADVFLLDEPFGCCILFHVLEPTVAWNRCH